jgi:hypothetical protein
MAQQENRTLITREIATKVRDVIDAGLTSGVGEPEPGKMCVEAAVCYALGLPHGDDPGCVSQSLRKLKIRLNDARWSSDQARAAGLRRLGVAQLGSAGVLDEREFIRRVVEMTIRRAMPVGLRAAASLNPKHAGALEAAAVRCEREGTREAAEAAAYAAAAVARDRVLAQYAEWVVEILIDMRAPGCEFLDLVPVVAHG